jgi:hypothetical protein
MPVDVDADFSWDDCLYSRSSTDSSDSCDSDELLDLFAHEQDHGGDSPYSLPDDSCDDPDPVFFLDADDAPDWGKLNIAAAVEAAGKLPGALRMGNLADCRAQKRRRLVMPAMPMSAADRNVAQLCDQVPEEPAAAAVSNLAPMMGHDGWPMDCAVHNRKKRKRRSPKGAPRVRVSKEKGAPHLRRGGGASRDKEPSKKAAAAAQHAPFESDESTSVPEADVSRRSLDLAISMARSLELNSGLTDYELCQENLLSKSLQAGQADMLTWQQAEVIIQAVEAGVITLPRRPLTGTKVERPPRHARPLNLFRV